MPPQRGLAPTPSQTIGPFFHDALLDREQSELVTFEHPSALCLRGTVYDGAGEPVPDAMVELWQADAAGRYHHLADHSAEGRSVENRSAEPQEESFIGFGRSGTGEEGRFSFVTMKPGPVPGPEGRPQAPHINVSVFARGLLRRLATRIYFPYEERTNAADPVLGAVEDTRRSTLVAHREGEGLLRFDIHLQGERETVFFDV